MPEKLYKTKENMGQKTVAPNIGCYLCNSNLGNSKVYFTKTFDQDTIYAICGECAKKLAKVSRMILADLSGNIYTQLWIANKSPWKPKKEIITAKESWEKKKIFKNRLKQY